MGRSEVWIGRLITGAACVALAGCGSSSGSSGSSGSSSSTLNFAIVSPFTGSSAAIGQTIAAACWPAIRTINEAGGVLGHSFNCSALDTKGDPADAVPAVARLLATDSNLVGVLGPSTGEATAVVPQINAAKIPMITFAGQSIFDKNSYAYLYRPVAPDETAGFAQVLWARHLGFKRAAFVYATDSGSQGDKPGAVVGWHKVGGTAVADVGLTPDQSSYRSEVSTVLAGHPQVIFTESDGPTAVSFFSELVQLNNGKMIPTIGTQTTQVASYIQPMVKALGLNVMKKDFYFITGAAPVTPPKAANALYMKNLLASSNKIANPAQYENIPVLRTLYDGLVGMALAMLEAKSTTPSSFNKDVVAVLNPGPGKVVVNTFQAGKAAIAQGKSIRYVGAGGPITYNAYRNSYGAQGVARLRTRTATQSIGSISFAALTALG